MFHNVSTNLLFVLTIIALASYTHQQPSKRQKTIDTLNKLLKCAGWSRLDYLEVKYYNISKIRSSFSGKDLFIAPGGPGEFIVTKKNVNQKNQMANKLLGCVYATAMLEFIQSMEILLLKSHLEIRRAHQRAYVRERRYNGRCNDSTIKPLREEHPDNYRKSCELFNAIMELLENSARMFDYMVCALTYLLEPLSKIKKYRVLRQSIQSLVGTAIKIRDMKTTINYEYREHADEGIKTFHQDLRDSLKLQKKQVLLPFQRKYCILPKDIQLPKESQNIDNHNQTPSMAVETTEDEITNRFDLNRTPFDGMDVETTEDETTYNVEINQTSSMDVETTEDETTYTIDLNRPPLMDVETIGDETTNIIDHTQVSSAAETIEDEPTDQLLDVSGYTVDEVKLQIEKHVEEVINKLFWDLGFNYIENPN